MLKTIISASGAVVVRAREVSRTEVACESHDTKCLKCGRAITLHFNGGELDARTCCNVQYELEHGPIYFVVTEFEAHS